MSGFYDDNFGHWEDMNGPDGEDNRAFYRQVQRESRWKKCKSCGARVKLRPDYSICNSCADAAERGWDCG